jgi:vacuolar-type H+-ATPase subunit I/STV1
MSVAYKKSKERAVLEERLVKYGFDPKYPEFSNLGRTALRKKVEEMKKEAVSSNKEAIPDNKESISDNKEAIKKLEQENKKLEQENKKLKDIVEKLKSDLAERSNFYCWHCGFELKDRCPRCGYGMTDTAYRDIEEERNEESDEDNAQWDDKDYEDMDEECCCTDGTVTVGFE